MCSPLLGSSRLNVQPTTVGLVSLELRLDTAGEFLVPACAAGTPPRECTHTSHYEQTIDVSPTRGNPRASSLSVIEAYPHAHAGVISIQLQDALTNATWCLMSRANGRLLYEVRIQQPAAPKCPLSRFLNQCASSFAALTCAGRVPGWAEVLRVGPRRRRPTVDGWYNYDASRHGHLQCYRSGDWRNVWVCPLHRRIAARALMLSRTLGAQERLCWERCAVQGAREVVGRRGGK